MSNSALTGRSIARRDKTGFDPYFVQAAALRLAIETNRQDFQFAQKGGRIIYLMDASVVRFFLDPVRERERLQVFGSGNHDYSSSTALVTAEFLFSRGLAGQGDVPGLIPPAHGAEVQRIADALARSAQREVPKLAELTPSLRNALQVLVDKTRGGEINLDEAAEQLTELVPDAAAQLLRGVLPANQLRRLHEEDLLRALALHPAATRRVMQLDQEALARKAVWAKYLVEERKRGRAVQPRRGGLSEPTSEDRQRAAENDAEVLVQLELLEEEVDGAHTRYVLVTADDELFDAYAHQWARKKGDERPPFALRRLLQYVPILNMFEMPNGIERSDILDRAAKALDQALAGYREVDRRGYPQTLMMARVLAREGPRLSATLIEYYGFNPLRIKDADRPCLADVSRIWREGFRRSVVLNTQLMTRRLRTGLEPVEALLKERTGLREALHTVTRRLMDRVERAHRRLNNSIQLDHMAAAGTPPPRAKLWLSPEFPSLLRGLSLTEALNRLTQGDKTLLGQIKGALDSASQVEACLFAACLALRCGLWFTGWDHATRAMELLESEADPRWDTAAWLVAFSARYSLPSVEALSTADNLLRSLSERASMRDDLLLVAQAEAERATLVLVLHYIKHLQSRLQIFLHSGLPPPSNEYFAATMAAHEALESAPDVAVARQLDANIISAAALARVFGAEAFAQPEGVVAEAHARLLNSASMSPILAAEMAMVMGAALPEKPTHDRTLTDLDRAEFDAFAAFCRAETKAA